MIAEHQLRDQKGRFLHKENPKKFRLRLTNDEKRLLESLRIERIEVNSLFGIKYPKDTVTTPMRLLPNILLRAGTNFESLILETVRGEYGVDSIQLKEIITKLITIHEAMGRLAAIKDDPSINIIFETNENISEPVTIEKEEEDLVAIQKRSQLRAVQHFLYALKFMNRLDEVLLLSLEDPDLLVHTSKADINEVQSIISLLEKEDDLRFICDSKFELKRLGSMMMYKSRIPPHYLLILISSDPKAMLETRKLREIEDTIYLLSDQLVGMLQRSISEKNNSLDE